MLRKTKDDEGGFTLIELLVVILIIGILAAVALPTFLNQGKKGADAAAKSDLRAVATKVEACAASTNDYTKCLGSGATDPDAVTTLPNGMTSSNVTATGGYTLTEPTPKGSQSSWSLTSQNGTVGAPA